MNVRRYRFPITQPIQFVKDFPSSAAKGDFRFTAADIDAGFQMLDRNWSEQCKFTQNPCSLLLTANAQLPGEVQWQAFSYFYKRVTVNRFRV